MRRSKAVGVSDTVLMRDLRQWVCWCAEVRDGKSTKVPYSPTTGSRARSDDPTTWATLVQARGAAQRSGREGIGFMFTSSDPFCGVDLDSCVSPDTGERGRRGLNDLPLLLRP